MRPLVALALLALVVGLCAAARRSSPRRPPPNDIKNCNVYPGDPDSSSSSSNSSSSSSSSSSGEDIGGLQNDGMPCPEVDASQCHSGRLTQCGRCQACLVYLETEESCKFPYPTNAECGPQFVCSLRRSRTPPYWFHYACSPLSDQEASGTI